MLGNIYILAHSTALAISILPFPECFSPPFLVLSQSARLSAIQQRITNPIGAHGLPNICSRKLFDGGMPCNGGCGICRNSSTRHPASWDLSFAVPLITHPQSFNCLFAASRTPRAAQSGRLVHMDLRSRCLNRRVGEIDSLVSKRLTTSPALQCLDRHSVGPSSFNTCIGWASPCRCADIYQQRKLSPRQNAEGTRCGESSQAPP